MNSPKTYFSDNLIKYEEDLKKNDSQMSLYSWLRLIAILVAGLLIYFFATTQLYVLLIPVGLSIIGFFYFVNKHLAFKSKSIYLQSLIEINQLEIKGLNGDYADFDGGKELMDSNHNYSYDLDVFGSPSLFQSINRTTTLLGRKRLAYILQNTLLDKEAIVSRQQQIKELDQLADFRQSFQAYGMETSEGSNEIDSLLDWLNTPNFYEGRSWLLVARYVLPILLLISVGISIWNPALGNLFWLFLLANMIVYGMFVKKINHLHSQVSKKNDFLNKYAKLFEVQSKISVENKRLTFLKSSATDSVNAVMSLKKKVATFDTRLNQLVGIFLNAVFLFDFHCINGLEKWKKQYKDEVPKWFDRLGEQDALNSLANFAFCHPSYIYPNINENSFSVEATELGHPLIPVEECITNDLVLGDDEKWVILTGANMSGKSTFLRTLGINTILALIGCPVFAKTFNCPLLEVKTSMRLTDSLSERSSYFYAELKRLASIIDDLAAGKQMLVICDEVLKGTNSEDKLSGSMALLKRLVKYQCLGIIATHDLDLGLLEEELPQLITNHCFESTIEGDELFFDYKLDRGIAKNRNATFLMDKMGIT